MRPMRRKLINSLINLFDNPITKALAFSLWAIPLYYYLNAYAFNLILSERDLIYIQNFIEWLGILYGMLTVLLLINVWTQFDALERAFDREADSVLAFYNSIILITSPSIKRNLKIYVFDYIEHVRRNFATEFIDIKVKRNGELILNEIMQIVVSNIHKKKSDSLSIELLRLHNEWVSNRGDRLSFSIQRMPRPVLTLFFIGSALWLMPFFTLQFTNPLVGMLLIGGVTLLITSIILIMVDLDEPFKGNWSINLDTWDKLLIEKIDEL